METTNIANLKNRLSEYLRKVRGGTAVVILDRGRPVARIERVSGTTATDEHAATLVASGLARAPTRPVPLTLLAEPPPRSDASVLAAVLEERAEGR